MNYLKVKTFVFQCIVMYSMFFHNDTKLADLTFLYDFVVKSKINSAKSLHLMGIELATLGLWHSLCLYYHALSTLLTHHCL